MAILLADLMDRLEAFFRREREPILEVRLVLLSDFDFLDDESDAPLLCFRFIHVSLNRLND
jgi:hypothetical protein